MTQLNHNSGFAAKELISIVERIERLTEEAEVITNDRKEVYNEAKAQGFDTAILRKVIMRRRKNAADVMETDALVELYEEALKGQEQAQRQQSEADGA